MANAYTTKDAVMADVEVGSGLTLPATVAPQIERAIIAASKLIDRFKAVPVGAYVGNDGTRYFHGTGLQVQPIDYCTDVTVVAVEEVDGTYSTWTADVDYYLWPDNAPAIGEPYRQLHLTGKSGSTKSAWTYGRRRVKVTATWGISVEAPADIERACIIQVARWFQRAAQGWRDSGGQAEFGQVSYTQAFFQ